MQIVTSLVNQTVNLLVSHGQMWHFHVALQQQFTRSNIHRRSPLGLPYSLDVPPPRKLPCFWPEWATRLYSHGYKKKGEVQMTVLRDFINKSFGISHFTCIPSNMNG